MNGSDTIAALRRANPRYQPGFAERTRTVGTLPTPTHVSPRGRRPLRLGVAAFVTAAATVVVLVVASPFGSSPISPAAAMQQAASATAVAADASGTVTVRIDKDGALWSSKTVRWSGGDVSITAGEPTPSSGGELRLVGGMMYAQEEPGVWIELGPPGSVDPDSGTTPTEYLWTVKEDAGGATFERITGAMTDLSTSAADDGATVYSGTVPAGVLARETGFKEGSAIRVLPYGYVAHDAAADAAAPIAVRITVGADGTIGEIVAEWGGGSAWTYRLTFTGLGSTPPPSVPADVRPLRR